jgi:Spy/CpxP family protein refolding chaperone
MRLDPLILNESERKSLRLFAALAAALAVTLALAADCSLCAGLALRNRSMQTGSSETLMGWKSGKHIA